MFLAGIEIDDRAALALADLLHDHGFEHLHPQSGSAAPTTRSPETSTSRARNANKCWSRSKTRHNNLHRPAPSSSRSTSAASATGWCNDGRTCLEGGLPGIHIEMVVAGVNISASAAARLALLLDRAGESGLAQRIGLAVDANSRGGGIRRDERGMVLAVLGNPPAELRVLREALTYRPRRRRMPTTMRF